MKVLVVEDEQIIRDGIVSRPSWEDMGVEEVRAASSAREAFAILESYTPDVVLSDIQMAGMDGLSMCRKIREKLPDVQVIILTGYDEKAYLKEAIDIGVAGFLEKPLSLATLRKTLAKVRDRLPQERQRAEEVQEKTKEAHPGANDEEKNSLAVQTVIRYIEDHYWEETLSLKVLAEQVYLTPQYLSSLFKSCTGVTLGTYMQDYRIEQAMRMLKDPAYRLYQISELVGYKDANYFTRVFKKKTGLTPMEYRNRHAE